jgi:hypothetical protein
MSPTKRGPPGAHKNKSQHQVSTAGANSRAFAPSVPNVHATAWAQLAIAGGTRSRRAERSSASTCIEAERSGTCDPSPHVGPPQVYFENAAP